MTLFLLSAPNGQKDKDGGFSLLEMLVALSVFSILSLMGMVVLRSYVNGQAALQHADEKLGHIQIASSIVRDDLMHAVIRPVRDNLGGSGGYFAGGFTVETFGVREVPLLRFVRSGNAASQFDQTVPGIQTLEYWFTDGAFVRRSYVRPDATEETPVVDQTLIGNLQDMSIRFRVQGTWVDGLDAIVGSRQSLPELVEITLVVSDAETLRRTFAVGSGI